MSENYGGHRIVALVEDGAWRVKDITNGRYLVSKEPEDAWHEYPRWWPRDEIGDFQWNSPVSQWGIDDEDLGWENGRAARMIASFADAFMKSVAGAAGPGH